LIIAQFLYEVYEQWPDQRVLMLTHVHEIIRQNHEELIELWPAAPVGINSAGLKSRDLHSPIIFAGIQSVHEQAQALSPIDLVIVDECHLIPRKKNTMYMRLLTALKELNPAMKIIGLSATPFRLDSGMLHKGDDALFDAIGYEISVRNLIEKKWLAPPKTLDAEEQINTKGVGIRLGEFIPSQLEAVAIDPAVVQRIALEITHYGETEDRKGWLVFCCGVKHAELMCEALRDRDIETACIFGDTKLDERKRIIDDFKAQKIRCLCSMGVLTTGFNARHVDLIALARPTQSTGLYIQMVGRGLRTFPGKDNCLVLDFGGNIDRHGPIDDPAVRIKGGDGTGVAPSKRCPTCKSRCAMAARECLVCGHVFPPPERKVGVEPARKDILQDLQPKWLDVSRVRYAFHDKAGGTPSLRVEYQCGLSVHREWICLQHQGYARDKALAWWVRRGPGLPVPQTIHDALRYAPALKTAKQILVKPTGKFTEIVGQRL
jgi:DNA repair protein RadD